MPRADRQPNIGRLMTLPEVASYLQIAVRTVYHWAQTGRLPGFKLGTVWRFKRIDVEKWIEDQKRMTQRRRVRNQQGRPPSEADHFG